MKKILIIFGTRPEAIKMAPLVKSFFDHKDAFDTKVCVTGQHRQMLDQVLSFFEIHPDFDLNVMKSSQDLYSLTAAILTGLKPILDDFKPDYVFVHGDTTTTMASGIAAFYSGAKVCHVEAGLRTYNKMAPFPEEINRSITGRIADYHFAPTSSAKANLLAENINEQNICVTGNTVIDALLFSVNKSNKLNCVEIEKLKTTIDFTKDFILVTGHRRENHGQGFLNICAALKSITEQTNVQIIYPVHLNPNVQKPVYELLGNNENVKLIDPLPYEAFVWLMNKAKIVITDSGGIQEEAPSLGKPVIVLRNTTERPEAVEAGTVILVGTDENLIVSETLDLLRNHNRYLEMSMKHNPYGNGTASQQIVNFMLNLS